MRSSLKSAYESGAAQTAVRLGTTLAGIDRRRLRRYLEKHPVRRLQIGAGGNHRPGWLNTNWFPIKPWQGSVFLDATRRFPFADGTFDRVFCEHVIEHVPYLGGINLLREVYRTLRPAGRLRIATPDMAFLVALLADDLNELQSRYVEWSGKTLLPAGQPVTALGVVNNFVRDWGHTFIYDRPTMEAALAECGFVNLTSHAIGESDDPEFREIDFDSRLPAGFLALESMTYEAEKPA